MVKNRACCKDWVEPNAIAHCWLKDPSPVFGAMCLCVFHFVKAGVGHGRTAALRFVRRTLVRRACDVVAVQLCPVPGPATLSAANRVFVSLQGHGSDQAQRQQPRRRTIGTMAIRLHRVSGYAVTHPIKYPPIQLFHSGQFGNIKLPPLQS